jgi:uncharacterized protein YeaO (DUF488 family)
MIKIKRIYDKMEKADGVRILVDRLWPRGVRKSNAGINEWAKDFAPSKELLTWFHEDKEKGFFDFQQKYKKELAEKKENAREIIGSHKRLTLITSVKDIGLSHIPTLKAFLEKNMLSRIPKRR